MPVFADDHNAAVEAGLKRLAEITDCPHESSPRPEVMTSPPEPKTTHVVTLHVQCETCGGTGETWNEATKAACAYLGIPLIAIKPGNHYHSKLKDHFAGSAMNLVAMTHACLSCRNRGYSKQKFCLREDGTLRQWDANDDLPF